MLIYAILLFVSVYFFVPLLFGCLLLATASRTAMVVRAVGWVMVALGVWGAVPGFPIWYERFAQARATGNYMDDRCKQAVEEIPAARLPADGVVLIQKSGNGNMGSVRVDHLVNPAIGLFQRALEVRKKADGTDELVESAWRTGGVPEMGHPDWLSVAGPAPQYELVIEDRTTDEDRRHRVEGVEVNVRERATQRMVAHKVLFAQWPERSQPGSTGPTRVCPKPLPEAAQCDVFDCRLAWPFVLRVLKPTVDLPASQLFHLHRGMTKGRAWSCASDILVAPGIAPTDLEWWSDGNEGWEDLHLRVRGSDTDLICGQFFWGGAMFRPSIRFDDGLDFPTLLLAKAFRGKASPTPRSLPGVER